MHAFGLLLDPFIAGLTLSWVKLVGTYKHLVGKSSYQLVILTLSLSGRIKLEIR